MAEIGVSGGANLERRLRNIRRKLKGGGTLRMGFLEGSTYPDGMPVAMVAAAQNFGAPAAGIPARPFFSDFVASKSPNWGIKFMRLLKVNDYDVTATLAQMGAGMEGQLRQSIVDTNSPPLKAATIRRKGFDKPLIDGAIMINSISSEVVE